MRDSRVEMTRRGIAGPAQGLRIVFEDVRRGSGEAFAHCCTGHLCALSGEYTAKIAEFEARSSRSTALASCQLASDDEPRLIFGSDVKAMVSNFERNVVM